MSKLGDDLFIYASNECDEKWKKNKGRDVVNKAFLLWFNYLSTSTPW